jgi:hypothetical protein
MPSSERRSAEEVQLQLAKRFAAGMLPAPEFETAFLAARGEKWDGTIDLTAEVLDQIFYGVDDYVSKDSLREPEKGDLDEEQLREIVRTQLRRLDQA